MISFPNAKINLGLNIVEKRPDNFHNIETVFYPVPWNDILEIIPSDRFQFDSSGIVIDTQSANNLCTKVYNSLKDQFSLPSVSIHLHKVIPIGAGLGGGSSDAAFTAKLLNDLFGLSLTDEQLEEIVRPLGSDCAFFINNQPIFALGKGDRFEPIPLSLKGKFIVLIYPNLHISTKEAYDGVVPQKPTLSVKDIITKDIREWKDLLVNDFEKSIFPKYPILREIKDALYQKGAVYASMSGSGSTLFGIFDSPIDLSSDFPKEYSIKSGVLS